MKKTTMELVKETIEDHLEEIVVLAKKATEM